MTRPLPPFDPAIAELMRAPERSATGLPGLLGMRIDEMGPGWATVTLEVRDDLLTPFGNLHGGVLAALMDHTLGIVVYPHMKPGQWAATTEFKLNYLAPVKGGELCARADVLTITKRTAVVRAEVTNDDRLVCVAQGTLLVVDPKPPA